jgi:hypothetical protein
MLILLDPCQGEIHDADPMLQIECDPVAGRLLQL